MKYISLIALILILASCSINEETKQETTVAIDSTQEAISDINSELAHLDTLSEENTNKMKKISKVYTNEQADVQMEVWYMLDQQGKIEQISISASNWDLSGANEAAQVLVGKTLQEAIDADMAGWSLTTPAVKSALKDAMNNEQTK